MTLSQLLLPIHISVSISLIGLILIQAKGVGLGATFGGSDFYRTKRGVEKMVFVTTIILALLFTITSLLTFLYR